LLKRIEEKMLTNVPEISVTEYIEICKLVIENNRNLIIIGSPGNGKSEIPESVAKELGRDSMVLDLSVLEAPDLVGIQVPDRIRKVSEHFTPDMLPLETDENCDNKIVAVFNELDKCAHELQAPMLSLFDSRRINHRRVNLGGIIATANKPTDGAMSKPINKALTNRCLVYVLKEDAPAWLDYANKTQLNAMVHGFISKNPDYLYSNALTNKSNDPTEYNKPSPRSWTLAAKLLDELIASKRFSPDAANRLIAGYVGTHASVQFQVWIEFFSRIEGPMDTLAKTGIFPNTDNWDDTLMFFSSLYAFKMMINKFKNAKTPDEKHTASIHVNNISKWLELHSINNRPDQVFAAYKSSFAHSEHSKIMSEICRSCTSFNDMVKLCNKTVNGHV
jgi:MoxR-like ATPase